MPGPALMLTVFLGGTHDCSLRTQSEQELATGKTKTGYEFLSVCRAGARCIVPSRGDASRRIAEEIRGSGWNEFEEDDLDRTCYQRASGIVPALRCGYKTHEDSSCYRCVQAAWMADDAGRPYRNRIAGLRGDLCDSFYFDSRGDLAHRLSGGAQPARTCELANHFIFHLFLVCLYGSGFTCAMRACVR
jgi:hypothetical protein